MFADNLAQAWDSLKANKLRSILTMLGVTMGVFSIITILAIGNATQQYINAQFEELGANIVSIQERSKSPDSGAWLTLDDLPTIMKVEPRIKNTTAIVQQMGEIRISSKKGQQALLFGIMPNYRSFTPLELSFGRFINDNDIDAGSSVVVVEDKFARKYYDREDIRGELITYVAPSGSIAKLKVVGVIKSKPSLFGDALEEYWPVMLFSPISKSQDLTGSKRIDEIDISVDDPNVNLAELGQRLLKAMEFKHKTKDHYLAQNSADVQKSFGDVMFVVSMVLLAIAIITLIVGGIGIVNILLVSVKERTREIGIRRAIGASKKDIVVQFLAESVILTGTSGVLGIVVGVVAGLLISQAISIPPVVDFKVSALAFLGSILLGIAFGVYPAKKAADLDPIEALRYE